MSTLYLHIGMPKTGTTYIQSFMRKNAVMLKENGYVYPKFDITFPGIGVNRNAHFMVCRIRDEEGNLLREKQSEVFENCFAKIGELFEEYDNIVLSEESLWNSAEKNYFNKELWADIKKKSEEMNFDLKIVVYLRRQDLFVQSYWAQQVKETYTRSFEQFLTGKMHRNLKLDYYERLSQIAEHIGKENMLVRVYEKSQYQGTDGTLISDFLETIGLELNEDYIKPERERVNRSLSGVYLETKRRMNIFDEFKVKQSYFSHLLQRVVDKHDERTAFDVNVCFTSPEQLKEYMANFDESNNKVAKEFLGREDGKLFFEQPSDEEIQKSVQYTENDILTVLGEMISLQHSEFILQKDEATSLKSELAKSKSENEVLKKTNKQYDDELRSKREEIKKLSSTVAWITAPLHIKIKRKLKRLFGKK